MQRTSQVYQTANKLMNACELMRLWGGGGGGNSSVAADISLVRLKKCRQFLFPKIASTSPAPPNSLHRDWIEIKPWRTRMRSNTSTPYATCF